jgi:predicted transcriptional regulator
MANTTITIELSPEIYLALMSLCAFYKKDKAQVIEMAVTHMAADSQLIVETFEAKIKKITPEGGQQ